MNRLFLRATSSPSASVFFGCFVQHRFQQNVTMISHHYCSNERDPRAALLIAQDRHNLVSAITTNESLGSTPTSQNTHVMSENAHVPNHRSMNGRDAVPTSISNSACGRIGSSPTVNGKICELQQATTSLQEEIDEMAQIHLFISCRENGSSHAGQRIHMFPIVSQLFHSALSTSWKGSSTASQAI